LFPFDAKNVLKLDRGFVVVASNAYPDSHEEITECLDKGFRFYRYHQFLGELIRPFTSISVTGTHGKTTTAGLMAHVFGGLAPVSYIVGDGTGKGGINNRYFILESCEYRRHFLSYHPDYAVITNVDFDHPDYFSGFHDVRDAFLQMAAQVKKGIIACGDDPGVRTLVFRCPVLYYGMGETNDLVASHVISDIGGTSFDVSYQGRHIGRFEIPLHGDHNVLNSLAVIGAALLESLDLDGVANGLKTFRGVRRRFAEKPMGSNILIDDYAHHPAEVTATIRAAKDKYPARKLVAVFQPHTYTRLKHFLAGFADSLFEADEIYVCDIFGSAREEEGDVTVHDLLKLLPQARHLTRETVHQLENYQDSVLLFMGAGDIQKYQRWLIEAAEQSTKKGD
jgi:UDP-N-acetylmuramate--alanine ligase